MTELEAELEAAKAEHARAWKHHRDAMRRAGDMMATIRFETMQPVDAANERIERALKAMREAVDHG